MKSLLTLLAFTGFLFSQDFAGSYVLQSSEGDVHLELKNTGGAEFAGELSGSGGKFPLSGSLREGVLTGALGGAYQGLYFQAALQNDELTLVLYETDAYGQPVEMSAETMQFKRAVSMKQSQKNETVVINGKALGNKQIDEIEETYGIKPLPGRYWYDSKSGLYGVEGYAAYGFMYPGHDFGDLQRGASGGNTGVIVNGRELPQNEWAVWSYILGYWIQVGSYWLDDKGNAGYEGNPNPVINLYAMAQQNAYRGQGGSGDNFWSSRFSAGNYDSGNQRGYVSVPGYGPVGYGF